ncbi:MAG TPA: serine/threonine-protein kinase, partial [Kofleriaceae bacterium]|nr:serine/threonine-protein kinase [Kofleriaceae bacterium]
MERIGEYFVRRLVGEGGMGKVYEAEERLSRRRVALKVLRAELGRSEEGRQMFISEMSILAHLDHPNIVRSLSCAEIDGELVMALEFLEGETLRSRLAARGSLPWQEAVAIAAQAAAALGAAHRQEPPIVHRDLKPENIMLTAGDRVKVMDFGIAKVMQAIRKSTAHSVGTLQYMSPEQIDAAQVDPRSDLYCLGLVLYEALAGRPPFSSESPRELLNLQCTAAPPPLPDEVRGSLPRGIERLMMRLLEKAPDARPASAEEVLAALDPFVTASDAAPARAAAPVSVSMPAAVPAVSAALPAVAPAPVAAARLDTIALVERAARPREVSTRVGVAIALALCLVTAATTYL